MLLPRGDLTLLQPVVYLYDRIPNAILHDSPAQKPLVIIDILSPPLEVISTTGYLVATMYTETVIRGTLIS